jgi:hypothetical protein
MSMGAMLRCRLGAGIGDSPDVGQSLVVRLSGFLAFHDSRWWVVAARHDRRMERMAQRITIALRNFSDHGRLW